MRSFSGVVLLPAIVASLALCIIRVMAISVSVPDDFVQCEPATINLTNSRGNVSIVIRNLFAKKPHINISLAENVSSWTWDPVDLPATDNFTILVTDRSPKRKTKLSQSLFQSTVDPSNNDSCLPAKLRGQHNNGDDGGVSGHNNHANDGGDDGGLGADLGDGGFHRNKQRNTTEVAVIAGVLGGVLFTLLALTVFMCLRRRRELKNNPGNPNMTDDDGRPIVAQRIRDMQNVSGPHRVVTLYGPDGRAEGQAVLSREGDAGWTYMSRMVPGLEMAPDAMTTGANASISGPLHPSGRRRPMATKRYDEEAKDGDLPSYGMSEYERKNLPKYDNGAARGQHEPLVLSTRRDSQGSRLTFFVPEAQEMLNDRPQGGPRGPLGGLDGYVRRSVSSRRSQLDVPSARRHNIDMGANDGDASGYGAAQDTEDDSNRVIVFGNEHNSYIEPHRHTVYQLQDPPVGTSSRTALNSVAARTPEDESYGDITAAAPNLDMRDSLHDSEDSHLSGYAQMLSTGERAQYTTAVAPGVSRTASMSGFAGAQSGQEQAHTRRGSWRNPFD